MAEKGSERQKSDKTHKPHSQTFKLPTAKWPWPQSALSQVHRVQCWILMYVTCFENLLAMTVVWRHLA